MSHQCPGTFRSPYYEQASRAIDLEAQTLEDRFAEVRRGVDQVYEQRREELQQFGVAINEAQQRDLQELDWRRQEQAQLLEQREAEFRPRLESLAREISSRDQEHAQQLEQTREAHRRELEERRRQNQQHFESVSRQREGEERMGPPVGPFLPLPPLSLGGLEREPMHRWPAPISGGDGVSSPPRNRIGSDDFLISRGYVSPTQESEEENHVSCTIS